MALGMQIGLGHIVLDGELPPPKGHSCPSNFWPIVCCGQTAGWMKMPLGAEVGLGPGDIVLNGDPAPLERDAAHPLFDPCLLWRNGCDGSRCHLIYGGRSRPMPHCIKWGPAPLRKGHSSPLSSTHVYCGPTVAHLSYY